MWYAFFGALVLVAAVFAWDYRRKAAMRESISKKRGEQLLKAGAPAGASPVPASPPASAPPATVAGGATEPAPAVAYAARDRLLTQAETLVYFLLKSSLSDLETLPKISLAAMVSLPASGYDREQLIRRLSRHQVDFVVCDKAMKIVAAVQLAVAGAEVVMAQRFQTECLKSAGIRIVVIDATSLPKRAELRALVCGQSGATAPGHLATPGGSV